MQNNSNLDESELVYGHHSVMELLKSPTANQRVNKVLVQKGLTSEHIGEVVKIAKRDRLIVQDVPKSKLDSITDGGNHQGMAAYIAPYKYAELEDIFKSAEAKGTDPFILILDKIEDPHNLGSILRTADAVGVDGIIIPKHRSSGLTSVVAKTSTGAIEHVPVVRVTNLVNTINDLKKRNVWIFGTAMEGDNYREWDAKGAIALVIGNEGKGVSPLVQKQVDQTLNIPMVGHVQSLNASVATGILLYQAYASRNA
ncbi:23S rRNA (guanosine(2251)-2'-O)-methyltransferase RlmB [Companilactobacillus mishanensis]|uniref:23S rRNA (Guanosine(2251)-2'-O)-methyltransferase RlmB n=1 Tax=Companilactobacillus mishanensis TaxID=2486008 RepID=A0A5P0ZIP3_9LACO|nr:23S rRNA (guanosine(2251)-2'-O)-methyltransferase RlmB [Companilactobacillus mishanensis]MQS52963.1 23S rRNA (guanosine(2251)-2'-O)-methyltransferase RlmB [Companilactobacillus mishanensis]